MKTRNGFVSNSSSTSFCVYGVYVDGGTKLLDQLAGKFVPKKKEGCEHKFNRDSFKFCPECGSQAWHVETDNRDISYLLECKLQEMGFDVVHWVGGENSNEGMYFGKDLKSDGAVSLDVLKKTEIKIKETFPDEKIRFYSDGGYN